MCTYSRTVYTCSHQTWGRCIKPCSLAAAAAAANCSLRLPHGLYSRKLPQKCAKCDALDKTFRDVKRTLAKCRELVSDGYPVALAKADQGSSPRSSVASLDGRASGSLHTIAEEEGRAE